jgi:regulation of enolase protein 1 (concanavalin A-like superfamily)
MRTFFILMGILSSQIRTFAGQDSILRPSALRPFAIVENRGQWDGPERFRVLGAGVPARLEEGAIVFGLPGGAVRLVLEARGGPLELRGEEPLPATFGFYLGKDSQRWRGGVPAHKRALYHDPSGCADLAVRSASVPGTTAARALLEYDLLLAPGGDLEAFTVRCEGVEELDIDESGALLLFTSFAVLRQRPPTAWEETAGGSRPVECRYRLLDGRRFTFEAKHRDLEASLVIDPIVEWAAFLGGEGEDKVFDLKFTPQGDLVAVGGSSSASGDLDAVVARINGASGEVTSMTYFGGSADERASSLALDKEGNAVICGYTASDDLPVTDGTVLHGTPGDLDTIDAFVARIDPRGIPLAATYLGGSGRDAAVALAIEGDGSVIVHGFTSSGADFPITRGAFQETYGGGENDFFISRLGIDAGGDAKLLYSTFLGGNNIETVGPPGAPKDWELVVRLSYKGLLIDQEGAVVIANGTCSTNYPTTPGAYEREYRGDGSPHVVVTRLRLDLGLAPEEQLLYSTFIGGSLYERASVVRETSDGSLWIAGYTESADFPTTSGSFQRSLKGTVDMFLARLNANPATAPSEQLIYSTLVGGSDRDYGFSVEASSDGWTALIGLTFSDDFPHTDDAVSSTLHTSTDGSFTVIDPDAGLPTRDQLLYSTYVGGDGFANVDLASEASLGSALRPDGKLALSGFSASSQLDGLPGPTNHGPSGTTDAPIILFDLRFPRADFTLEGPDGAGKVTVDAGASTTPAGTALERYEWDFGDGATAPGPRADHLYAPGRYTIVLRVFNDVPLRRSKAKTVTVPCAAGEVAPWTSVDVGTTGLSGSARLSAGGSALDVCAGGSGIGLQKDSFHFVYREVEGDFDLAAEVGDLAGASTGAHVGLMARESFDATAAHASILRVKRSPEGVSLYQRLKAGLSTKIQSVPAAGRWLRLTRREGVLAAYHSADGRTWSDPIAAAFNPAGKVLVGFAVAAKDDLSSRNFAAFQIDFGGIAFSGGPAAPAFLRADADGNGAVEITDAVVLLDYLFLGGTAPACSKAADADDSGELDITDAIYALAYLYLGGPAPPAPFPVPGTDPTPDALPCGR